MIAWFQSGGPVMWAILACSVTALAIFLERIFTVRRSKIIPKTLLSDIEELIAEGKLSEAEAICRAHPSFLANILHAGIRHHGKPREHVKEGIVEVGKKEALRLSRHVGALGTIAHISPLLGLLGTVLGMTNVFQVITEKGVGNAQYLAGGISEALITTIAGLIVAIPTLVAFRFLNARIRAYITEAEECSVRIMDHLARR